MSVSDVSRSLQSCKDEFQPPIGHTHSGLFSIFNKILLNVASDVLGPFIFCLTSQLTFRCRFVTADVLDTGRQRACAVFFSVTDLSTFLRTYDHSQFHGVEPTPWDLVMQTRKGIVAGATSGAFSGPPTSPPLLCCCCCCRCAAVVVLRSSVSALCSLVAQFHLAGGSCACILRLKSSAAVWYHL